MLWSMKHCQGEAKKKKKKPVAPSHRHLTLQACEWTKNSTPSAALTLFNDMMIGCFLSLSFSKTLTFVPLVIHPYYQDLMSLPARPRLSASSYFIIIRPGLAGPCALKHYRPVMPWPFFAWRRLILFACHHAWLFFVGKTILCATKNKSQGT